MPHRILVVEDDPTLRLVLRDNLQSEGYEVDVAADGAGAVSRARASIPDLIVLDLTLPDHDGFEVLPILRSLGQVPIIVLTATGAFEAGAIYREIIDCEEVMRLVRTVFNPSERTQSFRIQLFL